MEKNKSALHERIVAMTITSVFIFTIMVTASGRYMEALDRGLVAVKTTSGYFLSWRLFGTDTQDTTFGFNVYKGTTKLNTTVITNATCYQDNTGGTGTYTVKPVTNGVEGTASEDVLVLSNNYLSIPLTAPSGGTTPDGVAYTYSANDCSIGDLDGDGQYEIVLKWDPGNSKDNSQSGYTGNVYLDAYKLNGTRLWRIDLGKNIRAGAHYTQFPVYDFDGDGKAEVVCKTADGTVDGKGKVIGSSTADYRTSSGYILSGPEYLTVFNGETGAADTTINYNPPRGTVSNWGDSYGNRVDRFLACVAYLDGVRPSIVMCRGYYTRSTLWALDWRNGKLTQRWFFDSDSSANRSDTGQGCHSLRVADVDGDGYDEIVYGACTIDHNGKGLYNTKLQHGDALHLSDMDPDRTGLEIWQVHEDYKTNGGIVASFRDAKDGTIIKEYTGSADNGRGMAAPVLSGTRGWQMWSSKTTGLIDISGNTVSSTSPSSINFGIWWDGDLLRELEDSIYITKYGGSTLLTASGCASNNSTKSTPCLTADIFGDWREELILRKNNNTALYIYTTTAATTYRLYTLMHDPIYRMSVASENVAYNQPPEPGIYINYDMTLPETKPAIMYYDVTGVQDAVQSVGKSRLINTAMKVMGDRSLNMPVRFNETAKSVSVYDCSGKMVKHAIVKKNTVNLRKDFGLSNAMYIVKVDAVSENLIK